MRVCVFLLLSFLLLVAHIGSDSAATDRRSRGGEPQSSGPRKSESDFERLTGAAISERRTKDALQLLQEGVELYPKWREGWWRLGLLWYQTENYPAARKALDRLVELEPKRGAGLALLGLCEFEMGDYGLSFEHLQRGLSLGLPAVLELGDVVRYHQVLASILTGRYELAQKLAATFARKGERTDEVLVAAGLAALRLPLLPAKLSQVLDADYIALIREVGEAQFLLASRQGAEASQLYESLTGRYPKARNLRYAYGALLCDRGELDKGRSQFLAELTLTPGSVLARLGLAFVGLQRETVSEVLPWAREAVQLDPKSQVGYYLLGSLLVKEEKLEEAARALENCRDLNPYASRVHYVLARVYRRLGRKAEALREQEAFERTRAIDDAIENYGLVPAAVLEKVGESDLR